MNNERTDSENYLLGMDRDSLRRYQLFDDIYQPATEERFRTLAIKTHMGILEIGCGIGQTACYMAKNIVPAGNVVAFDQSEALVEIANQYARNNGIDNVTFLCAKAQEYDYQKE
jgi:ubiquinone/menaquinone biosynthesis C-methylase UbiE